MKLAQKYNVEALLPPGRKSTEFKETRHSERGLAIKGTGIGQKVKGHKWERTLETRLEERKKAMMEMPELIRSWKQVRYSSFCPLIETVCPAMEYIVLIGVISSYREDTEEVGRSGREGRQDGSASMLFSGFMGSCFVFRFRLSTRTNGTANYVFICNGNKWAVEWRDTLKCTNRTQPLYENIGFHTGLVLFQS